MNEVWKILSKFIMKYQGEKFYVNISFISL